MRKLNLAVLAVFSLMTLMACAYDSGSSEEIQEQTEQSTTVKKTYKLKKFNQSCCSKLVEYGLEEVDGYIKSEANTDNEEITVWFDISKCTEKEIIKAINSTGYTVVK